MTDTETTVRKGAGFARGSSEQDVSTPRDFLDAVVRRFGPLAWDLAATSDSAKAPHWIPPEEDSLARHWGPLGGNLWLNPPYVDIGRWAKKAAETRFAPDARLLLLVPASIGSRWFAEHVHRKAFVLALTGRLTFEGHTAPYPKDLILAVYGHGLSGLDTWNWRGR